MEFPLFSLSVSFQLVAVQHVDVCMFSNGKFKNVVAEVDVSKHIGPGDTLHASYSLLPVRGKNRGSCRHRLGVNAFWLGWGEKLC